MSLSIFQEHAAFDPSGSLEEFLKKVPAKWVVYLLSDEAQRPVQLLCVKNLRMSLKRRLGGQETIGATRKVNYRDIVRNIHWRRVDSAFEADWVYLEAARELFPESYKGMVGFRPAWFVHVDPDAKFPRYVKTIDLAPREGVLWGPVEDKHAAARLIEMVEDSFDLCRYYNVLIEAPKGRACAYKEMGKCPAPCDGTIAMDEYRATVATSAGTLSEAQPFVTERKRAMEKAAGELRFEEAAKIKSVLARVSEFSKGPFRHGRPLSSFAYLSLQRGPRANTAKAFLITAGRIEEVAGLIAEPASVSDLLRHILSCGADAIHDEPQADRVAIVAHQLFSARATHGVFLQLDGVTEKSLLKGYRELLKQKTVDAEEGEGILKELQAM